MQLKSAQTKEKQANSGTSLQWWQDVEFTAIMNYDRIGFKPLLRIYLTGKAPSNSGTVMSDHPLVTCQTQYLFIDLTWIPSTPIFSPISGP